MQSSLNMAMPAIVRECSGPFDWDCVSVPISQSRVFTSIAVQMERRQDMGFLWLNWQVHPS